MAKKKSVKKAPVAAKKAPGKKAPAKKAPARKAPSKGCGPKSSCGVKGAHTHDEDEAETPIVLDAVSEKAIALADSSDALCDDLEAEVTKVVSQAVSKVYAKHGLTLSAEQAEAVALVLFGD